MIPSMTSRECAMSYTSCATAAGTTTTPSWSPTIASPGRTTTPPHSMTPLASHGCMAAGPCFAVVEWEKTGKPYSRRISVSRTEPSVTRPPTLSCWRRRNLMSPPTDSQGPTEEMQMTSLGVACSKASYSGESMPAGLSAVISGRWGTMRTVTARPAIFMPLPSALAPSIWEGGQPMTHRPSTRACVERLPSFLSISSETVFAEAAGPTDFQRVWTAKTPPATGCA
mmetsp:Transcript_52762/g.77257  ORF Transcript_52762/g.77257 Transcript_52762/m.77257 type:complete len:226 (-) Transcript_52762:81-758(-)